MPFSIASPSSARSRRLFSLLLVASCDLAEPAGQPQALVLNAPADAERPGYQLQLLVGPDQAEELSAAVLFPILAASINGALAKCGATAAHAETFLFEGELHIDPSAGIVLFNPLVDDPLVACVVTAVNDLHAAAPVGVSAQLPAALALAPAD